MSASHVNGYNLSTLNGKIKKGGGGERNLSLDSLKGLAAIAIILIHFGLPGNFGILLQVVARFGVPFFSCVLAFI